MYAINKKSCQIALQVEEKMANSDIHHYSGQYTEIRFSSQHVQQHHSNSQIHTCQGPKTKQACYDKMK